MIEPGWVTTGLGFDGYRIARHLGVVRGITVRSRSIVGNVGAALQTLVGGNITIYTELCERARQEAFDLMRQHAAEVGANAIVAMRYDANEVAHFGRPKCGVMSIFRDSFRGATAHSARTKPKSCIATHSDFARALSRARHLASRSTSRSLASLPLKSTKIAVLCEKHGPS